MENVYVHGLFFVIYLVQDGRSTDLPGQIKIIFDSRI